MKNINLIKQASLFAFIFANVQAEYSFITFKQAVEATIQAYSAASQTDDAQAKSAAQEKYMAQAIELMIPLSQDEYADACHNYAQLLVQAKEKSATYSHAHQLFEELLTLKGSREQLQANIDLLNNEEFDRVCAVAYHRLILRGAGNWADYFHTYLKTNTVKEDTPLINTFQAMAVSTMFFLNNSLTKSKFVEFVASSDFNPIADEASAKIFEQINQSTKPVIIDCYTTWCPPCKQMKPIFEKLAEQYEAEYLFLEVNIEDAPDFVQLYQIQSLPTFLFIKDGVAVDRVMGYQPGTQLKDKINAVFND